MEAIPEPDLSRFLFIGEAAFILQVHTRTLREWERVGLVDAVRQPGTGYRLFHRDDIERMVAHAQTGTRQEEGARRLARVLREQLFSRPRPRIRPK